MSRTSTTSNLAVTWAITAFSLLLIWALFRLGRISLEALSMSLDWRHWALLIGTSAFMAWSEGYRGFQLGYAPRFAARVQHLRDSGSLLERILAPLYAMGYFRAERRRLVITYALTLTIIALIIVFHQIPQPWRGLLDAGVVVGLSWGLVACWWRCYTQLATPESLSAADCSNPKQDPTEA